MKMDYNTTIEESSLKKVNLLALLLNFEKYWQNYSLSDGALYAKEVREEAKKIVPLFYEIYGKKVLVNPDSSINDDDMFMERQLIEELEKWIYTHDKFPKEFLGKAYTKNKSQLYYEIVFMQLESKIETELELPIKLGLSATVHEWYFRKKQLQWAGQLPVSTIEKIIEDPSYFSKMSDYDTLVMVADIRRSQDLVTYEITPDYYRKQIIGFISEVRKILLEDYAIFDRFTGDGFIAYFNKFVCEENGKDYYEMMLDACKRIQSFSEGYFDDWSSNIRKLPVEPIGLSIGVDSGKVVFMESEFQLLAIGDACVWATRMSDAGKKGQVVFNNIPYHRIAAFGDPDCSSEIDAITKNGESFKAFLVNTSMVNYKIQPKKDPKLDQPSVIN